MEKRPDLHIDIPDLEFDETEQTLVLPKQNTTMDEASQNNDTAVFRTEEIQTIKENKMNQDQKRRKRNRVKDVFKKRNNEREQDMAEELLAEEVEEVVGGNGADVNNQYSCPNCNSTDFTRTLRRISPTKIIVVNKCNVCGTTWKNNYDNSGSNDDLQ